MSASGIFEKTLAIGHNGRVEEKGKVQSVKGQSAFAINNSRLFGDFHRNNEEVWKFRSQSTKVLIVMFIVRIGELIETVLKAKMQK